MDRHVQRDRGARGGESVSRRNPRTRIDVLAQEAARALQAQREAVMPTPAELDREATVTRSSVDAAVEFARRANAGSSIENLLSGPPGPGEIE